MFPSNLASCIPTCSYCGSGTPLAMCSVCRAALYCNRACQRSSWPTHQFFCSQLQASASASALATSNTIALSPTWPDIQAARLQLTRSLCPPSSPVRVMDAQVQLATCVARTKAGMLEAASLLKAALATARELEGCNGATALRVSTALGSCHHSRGLLEDSFSLLDDTHTRLASKCGALDPATLAALLPLLDTLTALRRHSVAEPLARGLLARMDVPFPPTASAEEVVKLASDTIKSLLF
jgi:hypothetical protein